MGIIENQYILVLTTAPSQEIASNIAKTLLKNKLCACVNIIPQCVSIYEWEGKIEESHEVMLFIKTIDCKYLELERQVKNIHPYDVPEIIKIQINGGYSKYLGWIHEVIR